MFYTNDYKYTREDPSVGIGALEKYVLDDRLIGIKLSSVALHNMHAIVYKTSMKYLLQL